MAEKAESIALYIHYPFCSRKCGYCDFYSVENRNPAIESLVFETSLLQLQAFIRDNPNTKINTVFIGGGTPSLIEPEILSDFIENIDRISSLRYCSEFTIETNPETLTREKIDSYNRLPVTRLSLGIQSFQDIQLAALGRCASRKTNLYALERISGYWTGEWSADLIHGIPGQSSSVLLDDLQLLNSFAPNHISLYTLIPGHDSEESEYPSCENDDISWQKAVDFLTASGFQRYEVSNFCKPQCSSRHNLHYWKMHPFLGIGPSAASLIYEDGGPLRFKRAADIKHFTENPNDKEEVVRSSPVDFFMEYLMMGLRTADGVRYSDVERIFGENAVYLLNNLTARQKKYLTQNDSEFAYNNDGLDLLNTLLVEIFLDVEQLHENALNMQWP